MAMSSHVKRDVCEDCPSTVKFPSDLPQWNEIKEVLKEIKNCSENSSILIQKLQKAYTLAHISGSEKGTKIPKNVFNGLKKFLDHSSTDEERARFYRRVIPCIVDRVAELENLVPLGGLNIYRKQQAVTLELGRQFTASIVACAFLGLFPDRPCEKTFPLNAINFDNFFQHLENPAQCAKLRCILHFFERIAVDPGGPVGKLVIIRQVNPAHKLPSLDDWLSCDSPLCNMEVHPQGAIEDAGSKVIQVDFANHKIGGAVLQTGRVQEEIRFSVCPELITSMLLMEAMDDNEAILMQGFETYAQYMGYGKTLQFAGDHRDVATRNAYGNLENTICAIDANPASKIGGAKNQYQDVHILRELNKALTGFQQDALQPLSSREGGELSREEQRAMSEEYYSAEECHREEGAVGGAEPTADHDLMVTRSLPSAHESPSSALPDSPSQFHHRKLPRGDLPSPGARLPRQHSQSSSSSERGESPRQGRFMPQKQLSQTLPAVTLPWQSSVSKQSSDSDDAEGYERRRSSNLSDPVSRRSSSDSSRRSSSKRSSSEFSSEFEEYYESFQRQERKIKPIAKKKKVPTATLR